MDKKAQHDTRREARIGRKAQIVVLAIFCLITLGAAALTVWSIVSSSKDAKPGTESGVGADGFRAFIEDDANLGVSSVVSKGQVVSALGGLAKSVANSETAKVFNLDGNRGQTLTFPFVRSDGVKASLYIDMRIYKNQQALSDDHIYVSTLKAGTIKDHPVYYRHAQTLGGDREYHLMVIDGVKVYRFVVAQPDDNITISEVAALAALRKLASDAKL